MLVGIVKLIITEGIKKFNFQSGILPSPTPIKHYSALIVKKMKVMQAFV